MQQQQASRSHFRKEFERVFVCEVHIWSEKNISCVSVTKRGVCDTYEVCNTYGVLPQRHNAHIPTFDGSQYAMLAFVSLFSFPVLTGLQVPHRRSFTCHDLFNYSDSAANALALGSLLFHPTLGLYSTRICKHNGKCKAMPHFTVRQTQDSIGGWKLNRCFVHSARKKKAGSSRQQRATYGGLFG